MRLKVAATAPWDVEADVLAVPIFRDESIAGELGELNRRTNGAVERAVAFGDIDETDSRTALVSAEGVRAGQLLLVRAGSPGGPPREVRRTAATAVRRLRGRGAERLAIWLRGDGDGDASEAAAVGAIAGTYRPADLYGRTRETEASKRNVGETTFLGSADQGAVERGAAIGEGVAFARDLANRSANDLTPERMAEYARDLEADGCRVEILDPTRMEELGMGALLGVGQGSVHEPRLVVVRLPGWDDAPADRRLAIVGKGVCFDSGGISLKPAERMEDMKMDKSGAAAVIATARTVARLDPSVPLAAVAPMVENMPGGRAQRPGDVVRTMSGKTVEVINTDAEGRLILADALTYAEREGASHLIDIATLTGAASVAFGDQVSAVFARPSEWGQQIVAAGAATGEWFWEMPIVEDYRGSLDSPYADIVNTNAQRDGSLIRSALFLAEFVTRPWAHLDIAGSAYAGKELPHAPKGALGTGVTTLTRLAMEFATASRT